MSKRDYLTLHTETQTIGTANFTHRHKLQEQLVVINDMDGMSKRDDLTLHTDTNYRNSLQ